MMMVRIGWFILAACLFIVPAQAQDGLIGYWPMNEGAGTTVGDASGNGHDGTATDTVWTDGYDGMALEFNGTSSIVDIPYFPEVTPGDGATMAAWVYPTDTTRSCIVGQFEGYGMALFTNLTLKSVIWGDDWVSTVTLPQETWSHVAMTWDQANSVRKMYLNGDLVDEKANPAPIPQVKNDLGIGVWVGWPAAWGDDWFKGSIDEVKFWNRVLTDAEVKQAMEVASPVQPQGKLATRWAALKQR